MTKAYHYVIINLDDLQVIEVFATLDHGLAAKEMAEAAARHLSEKNPGDRFAVAGTYAVFCKSSFSFDAPDSSERTK